MKIRPFLKKLLVGTASLTLIAPLAINQMKPVNAAHKWITITTNHDHLIFAKPGSRKYHYSINNKGLKVLEKSNFYYHHRLYYRVNVPAVHNHIAYILASQTNLKKIGHKRAYHQYRHYVNHKKFHKQIKNKRVTRRHKASKITPPKMSSSQWYTTTAISPVSNLKEFNNHVISKSIADITNDRANKRHNKHYRVHLRSNRILNKLADLRAKQAFVHFSHFENNHSSLSDSYFTKDAKRLGINPDDFSWGENISRTNSTSTPDEIADQLNDGYMNNDANSNWSHRHNILGSRWTYVGVGSYHSNQTGETYQSELFTGK